MRKIIKKYDDFLKKASKTFQEATAKHKTGCKRGCYECCTVGFFDITLLDAVHLRAMLKNVPADLRKRIIARANEQLDILEKKKAFSREDPILKSIPSIDAISRRSSKMSCPALEDGVCTIYEQRPHICRIFGPTIRGPRRAVRLQGCGYFKFEIPEEDYPIFDHYAEEKAIQREMYLKAGRKKRRPVDTIIPAAIALDIKKWL